MPTPIIHHDDTTRNCLCDHCADQRRRARNPYLYGYEEEDHLRAARGIFNAIVISIILFGAIAIAGLIIVHAAQAREGAIHPIRAPRELLHAREACPNTASLAQCRGQLRRAYEAIAWQRAAREKAQASTSRDVVLDAIQWASDKYGVPAWQMRAVGTCESHLYYLATNGQYASWAQLSARHRSDPIIQRLTWHDPYAIADHVARYVKRYGWGEWQCTPGGGLRW